MGNKIITGSLNVTGSIQQAGTTLPVVKANETLAGTEANLTELTVGSTKYKVSGGGSITDVKVNGTSVVTSGVANIANMATTDKTQTITGETSFTNLGDATFADGEYAIRTHDGNCSISFLDDTETPEYRIYLRSDGTITMQTEDGINTFGGIKTNGGSITGLPAPTANNEAANKEYVDNKTKVSWSSTSSPVSIDCSNALVIDLAVSIETTTQEKKHSFGRVFAPCIKTGAFSSAYYDVYSQSIRVGNTSYYRIKFEGYTTTMPFDWGFKLVLQYSSNGYTWADVTEATDYVLYYNIASKS